MPLEVTPTEFRKNLYKLLDQVIASGQPISIKRKGIILQVVMPEQVSRMGLLDPHPDTIVGDPEAIIHMDWSGEWTPTL